MVKHCFALVLAMAFATPALAQIDDFPQIELAFGYGNVKLNEAFGSPFTDKSRGGFAMHTVYNLTNWIGGEYYVGYHGLGDRSSLLVNTFGVKVAARQLRVIVPYGTASIGGGSITLVVPGLGTFQDSGFATRVGVGLDVPITEVLSWKIDVSRIGFRFNGDPYPSRSLSTGLNLTFGY